MTTFWIGFGFKPEGFSTVDICKEDFKGKAKLGDLFLVKRESSSGGSGVGFYHAGVYCSEEEQEIIHFTGSSTQTSSSWSKDCCGSISGHGDVSKKNVKVFCGEDKFVVYRKDIGAPVNFKAKVRDAMGKTPEYNLFEYNCIHFALELLDVDSKTSNEFVEKILKIMKSKSQTTEMSSLMV